MEALQFCSAKATELAVKKLTKALGRRGGAG
jgi:hypothetical protein